MAPLITQTQVGRTPVPCAHRIAGTHGAPVRTSVLTIQQHARCPDWAGAVALGVPSDTASTTGLCHAHSEPQAARASARVTRGLAPSAGAAGERWAAGAEAAGTGTEAGTILPTESLTPVALRHQPCRIPAVSVCVRDCDCRGSNFWLSPGDWLHCQWQGRRGDRAGGSAGWQGLSAVPQADVTVTDSRW